MLFFLCIHLQLRALPTQYICSLNPQDLTCIGKDTRDQREIRESETIRLTFGSTRQHNRTYDIRIDATSFYYIASMLLLKRCNLNLSYILYAASPNRGNRPRDTRWKRISFAALFASHLRHFHSGFAINFLLQERALMSD